MEKAGTDVKNAAVNAYHGTKTAAKDSDVTAKVKLALHGDSLTKDSTIHDKLAVLSRCLRGVGRSGCRYGQGVTRRDPEGIFMAAALNSGRLEEGAMCTTFGQTKPPQHPVNRVARYAKQFGCARAIAVGRIQRANQRELRGLVDNSVQRVRPFLRGAIGTALGRLA